VKFSSIDRGPNSGQTVVNVENQNGVLAFDVQYAQAMSRRLLKVSGDH
jgi:hypothetical protein